MQRSVWVVALVLVVLCAATGALWIGVARAEARAAADGARREAEDARYLAERVVQLERQLGEAGSGDEVETALEPPRPLPTERTAAEPEEDPGTNPGTAADRVAALGALVDELLEVVESEAPGHDEARAALFLNLTKLNAWLRAEERARQEARAEGRRAIDASRAAAQEWVDGASQIGDPGLRAQSIENVRNALTSGDEALQLSALQALQALGEVKYDKEPFRDLVLPIAQSAEGETLALALYALANTSRRPEDLELVLRLFESEVVPSSATHLAATFSDGVLEGRVGDAVAEVLRSDAGRSGGTYLSGIWGARVSPELEAQLLEMARTSDGETAHNVTYYALSTLDGKSPAVVEHLVGLLGAADSGLYQRALWGLGHGVPAESGPRVVEAAKLFFEARSDVRSQMSAVRLVGQYGSAAERLWLEELVHHPDLSDSVRDVARGALEQLDP